MDVIFCLLLLVCGLACSVATIALLPMYPIQDSAAAQVHQMQPVLMPQLGSSAVWSKSAAQLQCSHWPWADFGSPNDMCVVVATDVAAVDSADATAVPTSQVVLIPSETAEEDAETHGVERNAFAQQQANLDVATAVAAGIAAPTSADKDAVTTAVASTEEAPSVTVESATEVALCSTAVHASTAQTTAVAAAERESTEPRHGSTPPKTQMFSHVHAAGRAVSATAELAVEVNQEVALYVDVAVVVEVAVAELDTADMHPYASVACDSHSSTELGRSVLPPTELHAVLAATAAASPAAAAVSGADAALPPAAGGVVPADTPVATEDMSADTDSAFQKSEAAMLSDSVIVESAAGTGHTAAAVQSHESQASEFWGQHPDETISPSCLSPNAADSMLSPSHASPNVVDIKLTTGEGRSVVDDADASSQRPVQVDASEDANARMAAEVAAIFALVGNELPETPTEPSVTPAEPSGTFSEDRPEVEDVESFTAEHDQNAGMAAELATIFALAAPPPQHSLAEPSSAASVTADIVVADSMAADGIVAFSEVAASVIADTAAISLPLQAASTAAADATRSRFDTQSAEGLPAEQSSLTAPVPSDEAALLTEATVGRQMTSAPEGVSVYHDSCSGMAVSSGGGAPGITEHCTMTAAAFPQRLHLPSDTESVRHAGVGITAQTVGKVIARAYSHQSVPGEVFSPMVLLGTPKLTLPGMYPPPRTPPLAPPHKMSCWLPQHATDTMKPDGAPRVYRLLFVANAHEDFCHSS